VRAVIKLCECGCGKPAPMASITSTNRGWIKGQPIRFIMGHHSRLQGRGKESPFYRHGMDGASEYKAYMGAKARCRNPNDKNYKDYGGRGIEFRFKSFEEFFSCLGLKPSPQHSLDRFPNNKDGHYEPGNVRWATKRDQVKNRRRFKILSRRKLNSKQVQEVRSRWKAGGVSQSQLAKKYRVSSSLVSNLIRKKRRFKSQEKT